MQNAGLDEAQAGIKDGKEEYQLTQICRSHHPFGRRQRGTKELLDESERGERKSWLKMQHSENQDHVIYSYHFHGK